MKSITSHANPGFRKLKDLVGSARDRRKHQASWIEGERLCEAFFNTGQKAMVLVVSDTLNIDALHTLHGAQAVETWAVQASLFCEISQLESSPGWGLMIQEPQRLLATKACDVVVLDRVQDPGNLGSMLRSAVAAEIQQAWCISGTVDPWSPKVLRSAMGAHFAIEIVVGLKEAQVIGHANKLGVSLLATANRPQSQSLYSEALDLSKPCAWVFGQEGEGVSQPLLQASVGVAIPQSSAIESLNVAAAASVCMFEMRRRRLSGRY